MSTPDLTGSGLPEDILNVVNDLGSGRWVAAAVTGLGAAAGAVGLVLDPIGELASMGAGWVLEHLHPLCDWFNDFTGDFQQVERSADQWAAVGLTVGAVATGLRDDAARDLVGLEGAHVAAYRVHSGMQATLVDGLGAVCNGVSAAVRVCASIVHAVHDLIREALSELVAMVSSALGQALLTGGLALPKIAADVGKRVARLAQRLALTVTGTLETIANLLRRTDDLPELLSRVVARVDRMADLARVDQKVETVVDAVGLFTTTVSPFVPPPPPTWTTRDGRCVQLPLT
ncbi:hypothetical protein KIN34_01290 [Cellulomonas sp. DKR-3]|uniref:ESX-1 secretion-associated protein EspA/EspE-like domain-containing protein n=1 Tax=Cellulomonas fulva TaxID=2835530 RepID=A0ABS5TUU8_9CELL|nr:hypothetical protein [Cellulomonas fulva]MBT0992925.1 hypothetical protein [Cellulomonas fulva]